MHTIHDVHADLVGVGAGDLAIKREQFIPQHFLDENKAMRDTAFAGGTPEAVTVARVPVAVVERWLREGFDIFSPEADDKAIVRRLKAQGLEQFLTTSKRV